MIEEIERIHRSFNLIMLIVLGVSYVMYYHSMGIIDDKKQECYAQEKFTIPMHIKTIRSAFDIQEGSCCYFTLNDNKIERTCQ